jgi:hypothetical protein
MQLNIVIDDSLMQEARRLNPQRSEQEVVETALRAWLALQHKMNGCYLWKIAQLQEINRLKGFFVIGQKGEAVMILNDEKFKPAT